MSRKLKVMSVALAALLVAVLAFGGSALQMTALISEAQAQSSETTVPDQAPAQRSAGGSVRPPDNAVTNAPNQPGVQRERDVAGEMNPAKAETILKTQGANSSSTLWGELRSGAAGTVSIPDQNAGLLVQDAGMGWLEWRAKGGPLQVNGGYAVLGILALLVLFYLIRGRIRIEAGTSGRTIERFKSVERFGHWLLAVSFIVLTLSGLNLLYGKDWILPLIGKDAFATVTMAGKWVHNNVAWAFMLSLIWVLFIWVRHNIPSKIDLQWIMKGGGLFSEGVHPPSRKFNAGQKLIFWSVIILGASISASGISLLFPFEAPMFAKTFAILNDIGIGSLVYGEPLPTVLTPVEEMMYAQLWHTIIAFAMIFIVLAHIYIGSVGMEGAYGAMGSGEVDEQWAREHHSLWLEEVQNREGTAPADGKATPAE